MTDMLRRLIILLVLGAAASAAPARISLNRPHIEALEREWAEMDSYKKPRKQQPSQLSENVRERFLEAYTLERQGRRQLAAGAYLEVLDSLIDAPELYIHANVALADFYRNKPAYENAYAEYLLRASRAMARTGQIDSETYVELGNYLISKGLRQPGEKALKIASVRVAEAGDHPTAAQLTILANRESSRRQAVITAVLCTCAAITLFSIGYVFYIRRRYRSQIASSRRNVSAFEAELVRGKEVNTGFMTLALRSMEELKNFNTFATRKLAAGQAKALYADVESGSYLQGVTEKFFEEFDNAFLNSHPDFYQKINSLLKPERCFTVADDNRLSPELRIAAFMMLGITDTARLAQVLNLSVNTIYTYRNRLRSRALDRDKFENQLAAL